MRSWDYITLIALYNVISLNDARANQQQLCRWREKGVCLFVCLFFYHDCLERWISIHQIQLLCHLPFPAAHVGFCIKMGQLILWCFILAFNTQWIFTVKLKKIQVTETTSTQSCLILTILQTTGGWEGRGLKEGNTKSEPIRSVSQGSGLNVFFFKGQDFCDE